MDSFDIRGQYDPMLPPGELWRQPFDTALMGLECKGGGGGQKKESGGGKDWDEVADLQHEQAMNGYQYNWDQAQRDYNHQVLQNQVQRHDMAQQHAYQTGVQRQQWRYANQQREAEYNAKAQAYIKSEKMYGWQVQMNQKSAQMAMNAQHAQTTERYQELLFNEQRAFTDYSTKKSQNVIQGIGADLDIFSKRMAADQKQQELTSTLQTERGVAALQSQESAVKGMQVLGQVKSKGQAGRSAEKQYQSVVAGLGRLQAAKAYELNRSDMAYQLAMNGVDATLDQHEAGHILTKAKLSIDNIGLEAGYDITQRQHDATALSIKGAHERAGQKIIHDQYVANVQADFNRMTKPTIGIPIPKPLEIPITQLVDPPLPVKGKPPVWGAGMGPGPQGGGGQKQGGSGVFGGMMTGASMGAAGGWWGAGIGAVVGGIGGAFGLI